jgi:hypothetical protein
VKAILAVLLAVVPASAQVARVTPVLGRPASPLPVVPLVAAPFAASAPSLAVPVLLPALPAASLPAPDPAKPAAPVTPAAPAPANRPADQPAERAAAEAGKTFDGSATATESAAVAAEKLAGARISAVMPGTGLKAMRENDEAWLISVVTELMRSKTGRRVLRDIEALERRRGYPVIVEVKRISNNGEFRYDSDLLVMDADHRKADPAKVAPIFAHELQHVLQRALDLPADALELEIESYTVESRVWSELGIEPARDSFAIKARRKLAEGLPAFVKWLGGEYKTNIALHGRTMEQYLEKVKKSRGNALRRIKRAEAAIAEAEAQLKTMREAGMPRDAVAAHARDELMPARRRLKDAKRDLAWGDRDIALLSTPEGRARFRKWADGVHRRARSLSAP